MTSTTTSMPAGTQHSTRRVIAAALAGLALGVGAVILLSPSAADDTSPAAPVTSQDEVGTAEPPATEPAAVAGTASSDAPAGSDVAAGDTGVVDQATAEQAALAYLGEGRVTWVTPEDDHGAAWEIEVTLPSGREVDVYVDANGQVIDTSRGLARLLP
jgi:hypothetical protein